MTKKRNQIFNYLYVIAILMVIDDHTGHGINFLYNIFPYDSFFMPLFVFCSGYFYKKTKIIDNFKHKIKKLLIPYVIWNIVSLLIAYVLDRIFNINWAHIPDIKSIINSFISGPLTSLNGASWFLIMLFWISILYNIFQNIVKSNKFTDVFFTILFLILGLISTYLCTKQYYEKGTLWVFALKIVFYIQFYHYGYIFKKYIENKLLELKNTKTIIICCICILINVILATIYGDKIIFASTSEMGQFKTWYLPLITSITGILFYYELMKFLSIKIGQNSITDFISRNTFVIMQTHLLFANIPNFIIYTKILLGRENYANFNVESFRNMAWLTIYKNYSLLYFFCGLIGSLIVAYSIEKCKEFMKNEKNKIMLPIKSD